MLCLSTTALPRAIQQELNWSFELKSTVKRSRRDFCLIMIVQKTITTGRRTRNRRACCQANGLILESISRKYSAYEVLGLAATSGFKSEL